MVTRTKKIFVGGLSAPTTLEDVKNYFEQFGPVCFIFYTYVTIRIKIEHNKVWMCKTCFVSYIKNVHKT